MTMTTYTQRSGEPITVSLHQLHMLMAGRIPLLQFCREFGWADTEADMTNPFRDRSRDSFQMISAEVTKADTSMPLITFHFEPASTE